MTEFKVKEYERPKNYSQARTFARDYGFTIRRDNNWNVIKVYPIGIPIKDLIRGTGVYETGFNDYNDAWDTMLSMWRAMRSLERNQKSS